MDEFNESLSQSKMKFAKMMKQERMNFEQRMNCVSRPPHRDIENPLTSDNLNMKEVKIGEHVEICPTCGSHRDVEVWVKSKPGDTKSI